MDYYLYIVWYMVYGKTQTALFNKLEDAEEYIEIIKNKPGVAKTYRCYDIEGLHIKDG